MANYPTHPDPYSADGAHGARGDDPGTHDGHPGLPHRAPRPHRQDPPRRPSLPPLHGYDAAERTRAFDAPGTPGDADGVRTPHANGSADDADQDRQDGSRGGRRGGGLPRKITVTRVAAMRSRQLTAQGIATVRRAANADGADKSGLTALIWAYMANFACDAALTVALANTLFFSAATGESKTKVALYLLVTLAPFAVIAPLIGPALDRIQRGRRIALASSYGVRVVLAIILALNFDSWVLYPAALGMLVMSKSFSVLKSAVTPRLLPPDMDLVRVNSRLQIFGLVGGTTVAGAIAGIVAFATGSSGALWLTAVFALGGAYLSMRIPAWVEVTEGEIATTFTYHGTPAPAAAPDLEGRPGATARDGSTRRRRFGRGRSASSTLRQPLGHNILTGLWGTGTIKVLIGFLFLYIPFVAKAHADEEGLLGLILTGLIAVAAGAGNVAGNAAGARLKLRKPATVVLWCTAAAFVAAAFAAGTHVLATVALAALLGNIASALAKVSLDAAIQQDLPDRSRASAFGRSETILQLSWVLGGALGVLLPTDYWIGFTVISCILGVGLIQTVLISQGRSVIPAFRGRRPDTVAPEVAADGSRSSPAG
ncbi:MFS transporter [Tomitella gaofuii]|uniref:MFS transporter n=1 Tax=Tomitella gaofuii TaxID=2760083 RepID=UPI0015FC30E1|nr:MFS transporter [Tomitella gaofuii]